MNQQQGQHLSQCKGSFSPEGKAMEDFRGLKNSPISSSTDDLRKGEWISEEKKNKNDAFDNQREKQRAVGYRKGKKIRNALDDNIYMDPVERNSLVKHTQKDTSESYIKFIAKFWIVVQRILL